MATGANCHEPIRISSNYQYLAESAGKNARKRFRFCFSLVEKLMREFLAITKRRNRNRVLDYFRQSIKNCSMQRVYIFSFAKLSLS